VRSRRQAVDVVTDCDKILNLLLLPRHANVGHVAALRPLEYLPRGGFTTSSTTPGAGSNVTCTTAHNNAWSQRD
jgi:hypothetical protein